LSTHSISVIQMEIGLSKDKTDFMAAHWPSHYGTLYDMGLTAFDNLFAHNPGLRKHFGFAENDPSSTWKEDERIRKMVLSLQQILTEAVNTLECREAEALNSFVNSLRELGGLHRAIADGVNPDAFTLLFALLPEVIVDVTSNRSKSGPLSSEDRTELLSVWRAITRFMANQVMTGWERNKVPTSSKYLKSYNEKCPRSSAGRPVTPSAKSTASLPGFVPDTFPQASDEEGKRHNSISLRHVALSPLSALRK
ncbi:hypothetical protein PMAYCL1PPCAC_02025, partial [Pristionchus mayeri]